MYSHNDNNQRLNFDTIRRADRYKPSNPPEIDEHKDLRCPYCLSVITHDGKACPECEQANLEMKEVLTADE